MIARRLALAVLIAASAEGFALGLSHAMLGLGLNSDVVSLGAVVGPLLLVTGVLWLASGRSAVIGAFVVPLLAVAAAAPLAAGLAFLAVLVPNSEVVLAMACVMGAAVGLALLWRTLPRWRLVTLALLSVVGLLMLAFPLAPQLPVLATDPAAGVGAELGRGFASGAGLVAAVVAGAWAAAFYLPAAPSQAEQALPADSPSVD